MWRVLPRPLATACPLTAQRHATRSAPSCSQQCNTWHTLDRFNGAQRSCREQLARHAERRRQQRAQHARGTGSCRSPSRQRSEDFGQQDGAGAESQGRTVKRQRTASDALLLLASLSDGPAASVQPQPQSEWAPSEAKSAWPRSEAKPQQDALLPLAAWPNSSTMLSDASVSLTATHLSSGLPHLPTTQLPSIASLERSASHGLPSEFGSAALSAMACAATSAIPPPQLLAGLQAQEAQRQAQLAAAAAAAAAACPPQRPSPWELLAQAQHLVSQPSHAAVDPQTRRMLQLQLQALSLQVRQQQLQEQQLAAAGQQLLVQLAQPASVFPLPMLPPPPQPAAVLRPVPSRLPPHLMLPPQQAPQRAASLLQALQKGQHALHTLDALQQQYPGAAAALHALGLTHRGPERHQM